MKKSVYKTGIISQETFVDVNTGEIVDSIIKRHGYIANNKEEFLMVYSGLLGIFMKMEQSEIRVYGYLLRYANGISFSISKSLREQMGAEIDLNERTIYNTLIVLSRKGLLFSKDGLYQLNPRFAFRGSSTERLNALKVIIELGCENC